MKTDHPILAQDSVARNIAAGIQTQHRVPMRPQPIVIGKAHKFGVPGHTVYVREAMKAEEVGDIAGYRYRADNVWIEIQNSPEGADVWTEIYYRTKGIDFEFTHVDGWVPNIHMRREVARTRRTITRTWVERVRNITRADAKATGFINADAFLDFIQEQYGPEFVDANNWMWCVEWEPKEAVR